MLTTSSRLLGRTSDEVREPCASSARQSQNEPKLPSDVSNRLGERLRAHYSNLMSDPMPERIIQLVQDLNRAGRDNRDR